MHIHREFNGVRTVVEYGDNGVLVAVVTKAGDEWEACCAGVCAKDENLWNATNQAIAQATMQGFVD